MNIVPYIVLYIYLLLLPSSTIVPYLFHPSCYYISKHCYYHFCYYCSFFFTTISLYTFNFLSLFIFSPPLFSFILFYHIFYLLPLYLSSTATYLQHHTTLCIIFAHSYSSFARRRSSSSFCSHLPYIWILLNLHTSFVLLHSFIFSFLCCVSFTFCNFVYIFYIIFSSIIYHLLSLIHHPIIYLHFCTSFVLFLPVQFFSFIFSSFLPFRRSGLPLFRCCTSFATRLRRGRAVDRCWCGRSVQVRCR